MSHTTDRHGYTNSPRRPSSIAELAERALDNIWDERKDLKHYLRVAEKYRKEGKDLAKQGDLENAFVLLAKAATLVLEKLPSHRDYQTLLNASQRNNLALNGQDILDHLSELKPILVDRFDKWLKLHPEGIDDDRTPEGPQHQVLSPREDPRTQAELNVAKFREEEEMRARQREQQRLAANEVANWRQQREEAERRDSETKERRKQAAVAAAHQAAQPGGYTQHVADPGRHQQQQDEFRRREEEINRRLAEQKRRQDQDAMVKRQQAADDNARAVRQKMALAAATPAGIPVSPAYAQSTPASAYLQNYPSVSSPSTALIPGSQPPSSFPGPPHPSGSYPGPPQPLSSYPGPRRSTEGPSIMPLENPMRYEGDSTDSESVHFDHDYHRRMSRQRQAPTPTRAPVSVTAYPPPITTTSPAPQQRIGYPQLMSPHQQRQGYYPSLNSMFISEQQATTGSSLLFNPNQSSNGHNGLYQSMLPPASAPIHTQSFYNVHNPPQRPSSLSYPSTQPAAPPVPPPPPLIQYPGYPGPSRPPPPIPTPASAPVAKVSSGDSERLSRGDTTRPDDVPTLKTVNLPRECLPRFLAIAKVNTGNNRETCGLLLGKDKGHKFVVTTLLIPKQHATSDTCTMDEEELVLEFTEERSLITLGWIHTHPSQSCFMSSVDLHTHSGFQRMLPESFAVVCAPNSTPNFGIFRLTDPPGLTTVLQCTAKEAFHPHPDLPIYTDADKGHVRMKDGNLEIVDLR